MSTWQTTRSSARSKNARSRPERLDNDGSSGMKNIDVLTCIMKQNHCLNKMQEGSRLPTHPSPLPTKKKVKKEKFENR